ncbi:MAG: hypothetical protein KatS3mg028_0088 [Bacteroidia bacterium]|nr:MAG: hypothetical protein KatS3mg028_0088 [Bacteroidia bacterium]
MKKRAITIGIAAVAATWGSTIKGQTWYFPTVSVINNNDPAFTFSVDPGSPSQNCITYSWNFGDGNTTVTSTPTVMHTYANNGNYNVSVCPVDSCAPVSYSCAGVAVNVSNASTPPTFTCSASLNIFVDSLASPGNYNYYYSINPSNATAIQYIWFVGSATYSTTLTGASPVFNLPPGTYSVCVQITLVNQAGTDTCTSWACDMVSDTVNNISLYKLGTTGINNAGKTNSVFNLYPNPVKDKLNVQYNQRISDKISILDVTGRVLKTENISDDLKTLDVSELENGIYYIRINDITKMFIKQ